MTYADVAYKVTQLGANSLKDFKHFKNFVTIPDAVTSIGNNAFRGSNLIRMYVESGVGFLPANAFTNCTVLRWLTGGSIVKAIGD